LATYVIHEPPPDWQDQAVLLGRVDEIHRLDHPAVGVAPANESLDADQTISVQADLRLVEHEELIAVDRLPQCVRHAYAGSGLGIHVVGEDAKDLPPFGLGPIEREFGVRQQCFRVRRSRLIDGDADAGRYVDVVAIDTERLGEAGDQFFRQNGSVVGFVDIDLQHGEFIASKAGENVRVPQQGLKPLRDHLQQRIADRMSQGVVDILEVVQVEIVQCEASISAARAPQRVRHGLYEERSVRQSRQMIVLNPPAQFQFGAAAAKVLFPARQRAGGDLGEGADRIDLLGGPHPRPIAVMNLHALAPLAADPDRYQQHGAGAEHLQ
jgi:hypothetical protein